MLTLTNLFLTGIADAYFDYDVTRTLAYGFSFDTQSLLEMLGNIAKFFTGLIG